MSAMSVSCCCLMDYYSLETLSLTVVFLALEGPISEITFDELKSKCWQGWLLQVLTFASIDIACLVASSCVSKPTR
jgi:hypothetical protein